MREVIWSPKGRLPAVEGRFRACFALLMGLVVLFASPAFAFNHPGLVNSKSDLDFIKSMVKEGKNPWKGAFDRVKSANNYLGHKHQAMAELHAAAYRKDEGERDKFVKDAEIVYGCALIWYISGDKRYADKAIEIMNAWAGTMKAYKGSDAALVAGYGPPPMIWGAEIIRYSGAGWSSSDIQVFSKWLDLSWNLVQKGSGNNPNWQQWMACAAQSIAVFQDDKTRWSRALELWRGKIATTVRTGGKPGEWGRDLWHAQMGIAPATYGAEIAWTQGLDLYKEVSGDNRILLGSEYVADCLANGKCEGTKDVNKGAWPYYQWVYNHYVNRKGLQAPLTQKLIGKYGGFEKFARGGWGTLTHNRTGRVDAPTSTAPALEPKAGPNHGPAFRVENSSGQGIRPLLLLDDAAYEPTGRRLPLGWEGK